MNRRPCIILGLLLCLPVFAAPQNDSGPPADILAVRNIEIIFHTAGSVLPTKDLDLMMSLFADDAVLTHTAHEIKVCRGEEQVRTYWADVSGPFRPGHHWVQLCRLAKWSAPRPPFAFSLPKVLRRAGQSYLEMSRWIRRTYESLQLRRRCSGGKSREPLID